MRARYLAGNTDLVKVRGSKYDTGEVLRHASRCLARDRPATGSRGHMSPIDAKRRISKRRSTRTAAAIPRAATTIRSGSRSTRSALRFFDEGEAQHSYTYAKTGRAVLGQPGARAFQIYDQKGIEVPPLSAPQGDIRGGRHDRRAGRARSASSPRCSCTRSRNSTAACRDDMPFDPTPAGRQRAAKGLADSEIELGRSASTSRRSAPIRSPAGSPSPSAASKVNRNAQVMNTIARADQGAVRIRRYRRPVLSQLPVVHRADPQCRIRTAGRQVCGRGELIAFQVPTVARRNANVFVQESAAAACSPAVPGVRF